MFHKGFKPDVETRFDLRQAKRVYRLYKMGWPLVDIARQVGIRPESVRYVVDRLEEWRRGEDPETKRRLSHEDRDRRMWREWVDGKSLSYLRRKYRLKGRLHNVKRILLRMELETS